MTATDPPGHAEAAVIADDTRFAERDAKLLAAIAEYGSVNRASEELGRSHARALKRIEALEAAFGTLVERTRGGSGGGGSRLTENARSLLDRYDRLDAAVAAAASVRETVLDGTVANVVGELADVDTAIGRVRGVQDDVEDGQRVQVRIPSDALTVHLPGEEIDPDATSARNRRRATVTAMDAGETVHTLTLDVDGVRFYAIITEDSRDRLDIGVDRAVVINWKATATRLIATNTPP